MKKIKLVLLIMGIAIHSYGQQPVGVPGNWTLNPDFSDEFNGGLDTNKWEHDPNDWGPWSWEPGRTKVNGGNLRLTIDHKNHTRDGKKLHFTSGIIRSKKDIKYGYFEVRMKGNPRHPGACPAFWTYSIGQPTKVINGQRVKYNEIDFPEIQQRQRNVNIIDWNIIRADDARPQKRTSKRVSTGNGIGPSFDPRDAFHVYGCLWEKGNIKFYIDGVLVGTADPNESIFQQHKQRLVISLGLREPYYKYVNGGRVATPTPNRPSGFPSTMLVDYVRTWQGTTTGGSNCSVPKWKSNATYKLKDKVSYNKKIWRWKSRTDGNCTPGSCNRWKGLGACNRDKVDVTGLPEGVYMYPNPAKDVLKINFGEVRGALEILVIDMLGKVVIRKSSANKTVTLDTSSLSKGLHILKIENGDGVYTGKLIIQ
ncbi:family 16 glycosylhydrolase [Aquimarina algiphila]|uniref:T9SS type A sorting domain-containing protein n=1 Tax=Aquimarina algiphila TaxID=2047982 RepID=UPI002491D193|nr:family 16 glycosylhydrolase [Aquimarina algiphila]